MNEQHLSKTDIVLRELLRWEFFTRLDAKNYNISSLRDHIYKLRKKGYNIVYNNGTYYLVNKSKF